MKPQIVSKQTIKPSSPTPQHLRNYRLSLLDKLCPDIYVPMVLFYHNNNSEGVFEPVNITNTLKKSLSKTLVLYYPFAGRLVSNACIDCNDEGVDFRVARISCRLSEILDKPEPKSIDLLHANDVLWSASYKGSLVIVQVTFFDCGGVTISTSIHHKIADGSTAAAFLNDWAAMARRQPNKDPEFISLMSIDMSPNDEQESQLVMENKNTCVTRMFVFEDTKILWLKEMVMKSGVKNPTRVEVVMAFIFKCAMAASSTTKSLGCDSKPAMLRVPVNVRTRTAPPLPENSVGNFSWGFRIMAKNENDKKLHNLVTSLKNGVAKFCDDYANDVTPKECYAKICDSINEAVGLMDKKNDVVDVYTFTSLCRFTFNQVNFGWGEPIWYSTSSSRVKNTVLLKDSPTSGIEAWVTLGTEDMAIFEEILASASLNPTAFGD